MNSSSALLRRSWASSSVVEIDAGLQSIVGAGRGRGGLQNAAGLDGIDVGGEGFDGGVFGLRFAVGGGDFAGADFHLEENGVDRRLELIDLLAEFEPAAFETGAGDVVFERKAEDEAGAVAGAAGRCIAAVGVGKIAAGEAAERALKDEVEFRHEFVALHVFADGRGAELEECLVDFGAVFERDGGGLLDIDGRGGEHEMVERESSSVFGEESSAGSLVSAFKRSCALRIAASVRMRSERREASADSARKSWVSRASTFCRALTSSVTRAVSSTSFAFCK